MTNVAKVFYFFALRNGSSSYLQIDHADSSVPEIVEYDKVFDDVNCLKKTRVSNIETALSETFQMIFITGKKLKQEQLQERIEFAKKHLARNGVIVFDYANQSTKLSSEAWKCVARLRCDKIGFVCVVADVAHGCAVYRPDLPSRCYADQHLSQYDAIEYLNANRAELLNLITWEQFELICRLF